jgi:hypothetical protein
MEWDVVYKVVTAAIVSIGGGGVIVFAMSSWLGKYWAKKLLANETHKLNTELAATKTDLELLKERTLRFQNDKILTYRLVVDVVSKILATFDAAEEGLLSDDEIKASRHIFNQNRIQVYGYLAMMAPQVVMDAQDELMDYLLLISQGTESYDWNKVRNLSLKLLNEVRDDIDIDKEQISYNGAL